METAPSMSPVLLWCHSGTATINAPDKVMSVLAGDLIVAPHGAFVTPTTGVAGVSQATGIVIPIRFPELSLEGGTRRIHLGSDWSARMIAEYSRSLLGELVLSEDIEKLFNIHRLQSPKLPVAAQARAVAKQLHANPADQRSLQDFANEQHVSTRTLQRQFQATTDFSFSEWRAAHRVAVAAELLSHNFTITNVASMVGFDATSSLTRAFKRHTGATPAAFTAGTIGMGAAGIAPEPPVLTTFARAEDDLVLWIYQGAATVTTPGYCRFLAGGETVTIPAGTNTRLDIAAGAIALPVPVDFNEANATIDRVLMTGMCTVPEAAFMPLSQQARRAAEDVLIPTV
ncbi:MAG: AraC family transcriptional regulator [Corynebacterium sp.]|uniref:helix-turn-helix domain-containing protein n=1 Tax=Corynebacterium sp. TaxID=1720 RepID=UPI0026DC7275|nr:AraC family transcriptional regulator [Corynebacterium sp.]MDO5097194.1 AraC family transcriptional regulator [Corynebacterium sp.]